MADNGWDEHKRLVLARLDDHGREIAEMREDMVGIKIAVAPISQMQADMSLILRSTQHQPHQQPGTPWARYIITVGGLIAVASITATGLVCSTPQGYRCGAQDIAISAPSPAAAADTGESK